MQILEIVGRCEEFFSESLNGLWIVGNSFHGSGTFDGQVNLLVQ